MDHPLNENVNVDLATNEIRIGAQLWKVTPRTAELVAVLLDETEIVPAKDLTGKLFGSTQVTMDPTVLVSQTVRRARASFREKNIPLSILSRCGPAGGYRLAWKGAEQ